jgi:anti-sigma factor RsiW
MCRNVRASHRGLLFAAALLAASPQIAVAEIGSAVTAPALQEIETAIHELRQPLDHERLSQIFAGMGQVQDDTERARLQQLLSAQLHALEPAPTPAVDQQADISGPYVPSDKVRTVTELYARIDVLVLGPESTVEDLRARDAIVSAIAGIVDPLSRSALLRHLEAHEARASELAPWR